MTAPDPQNEKQAILFVDDDPDVLAGLRRMLRKMGREWEMLFAGSSEDALRSCNERRIDVIVTDMCMPGMDGANLLTEISAQSPDTVRIVLSGHAQLEMIYRAVGTAHQYLSKPCDADSLKSVITRACHLRRILTSDEMRSLVSDVDCLPSMPALYQQIVEELRRDASLQRVGEIIAQDPGMTAKILQVTNSALLGLRREISRPEEAVALLGIEIVKALVLGMQVFCQFEDGGLTGVSVSTIWQHSQEVARLAQEIAKTEEAPKPVREQCFMAGVMHDVGRLILLARIPERYDRVELVAERDSLTLQQAEARVLGATHGEVGGYLLGLWGMFDPVVEAVTFHHDPGRCPHDRGFSPLVAVHAADALTGTSLGGDPPGVRALDVEFLDRAGFAGRVEAWEELALAHATDER